MGWKQWLGMLQGRLMMSRKDRRLRKAARGGKSGRGEDNRPIVGDMAQRMRAIAMEEKTGIVVRPSPQLPIHYGGQGNGQGSGQGSVGSRPGGGWGGSHHSEGIPGFEGYSTSYHPGPVKDVGYHLTPKEDETVFRCDSEDVTAACPVGAAPGIYVNRRLFNAWIDLADDYNVEWLAYLHGGYNAEKGRFEITRMYFPPQTANGGHVDVADDYETEPGTIGAVHSHVKMGVFFSAEDLRHSNWPVEIVVNARGDVKAMVRYKLGCGAWAKHESKVWLTGDNAPPPYTTALNKAFLEGAELEKGKRGGVRIRAGVMGGTETGSPIGGVVAPPVVPPTADTVSDVINAAGTGGAVPVDVPTFVPDDTDNLASGAFVTSACRDCDGKGWGHVKGYPAECGVCGGKGEVTVPYKEWAEKFVQ